MTKALPQLLLDAAEAAPEAEAVRCSGASLTYGELARHALAVAGALREAGVGRGDRVGINLQKRVETIAAVYGAMLAGAAYVPLDPKAPTARVAMVASDCSIGALIATPDRASAVLPELTSEPPAITVVVAAAGSDPAAMPGASVAYDDVVARPHADLEVTVGGDDLAYILYTSGSTGVPKGVMLTHRNALAFVEWCAERIGIGADDRVSNHAPLHFDLSVFDLYLAALGRAALVLVPEEDAYFGSALARLIREERITLWYSVPSALMLLTRAVQEPGDLRSLRSVVFAGEVYPTKYLRRLRELLPDVELWNLYGPTETNVCTYHRVDSLPEDDRTIPIGRACENGTDVFAVTDTGGVAGVGEEGELYVRGPTVMRGYWNRAERTAEVLVPDPRSPDDGALVYRTGDLVRLRPDGELDFLGRRDHQVKSRGYRIELGDVEAALNALAAVEEAVAVAVPHDEWGTAIVAAVVAREGHELTAKGVKRQVALRLPRYMVPSRVDIMQELPRTSNGKIDRRRVLEEASRAGAAVDAAAARR